MEPEPGSEGPEPGPGKLEPRPGEPKPGPESPLVYGPGAADQYPPD